MAFLLVVLITRAHGQNHMVDEGGQCPSKWKTTGPALIEGHAHSDKIQDTGFTVKNILVTESWTVQESSFSM